MKNVLCSFAVAGSVMLSFAVEASETYPSRPIRMIIPTGAGGITDILGRFVALRLGDSMGERVVTDNRPGASGIVGSQIVAEAVPNGYTLLMAFPSHTVNPSLVPNMPYDTVKAFAPITRVSTVSLIVTVAAQSAAKSVKELIEIAKNKPGALNFGSVGAASGSRLGAELFRSMAGITITNVSYKGTPQVLNALLSGEIQVYLSATAGAVTPLIASGKIRALGVSTKERLAILPDVPSIADTIPGYEVQNWNGILAPARTPKRIIDRLHNEIVQIIRSPDFVRQLTAQGAVAIGDTPKEFEMVIRADIEKWAAVIKDAGIRNE